MSLSFYVQKVEPTGVGFTYREFSRFRHRIARSIGLKGVYPGPGTDMYFSLKYLEIPSEHPAFLLIAHSDCDGSMGPDDCGQAGAYLKTLIPEWEKEISEYEGDLDPDLKSDMEDLKSDIEEGKKLADLMLQCHENNETLLFL